nr:DUF922 domain-containing protein [uncultured Mucilaginibacter sp.]
MSQSIRFALLLLLLSFTSRVMAQDEYKLAWRKDSLLKWSDFKGPVDATSKFHALTLAEIFFKYNWALKNNKYIFTFTGGSFLNTNKSWSVQEKQTPALLRHEQVHFDIAEIFARISLQRLTGTEYTATFKTTIDEITEDNLRNMKVMQDLYDEQTDHSKEKKMQARWEIYIANLLKEPGPINPAWLNGPGK